MNTFGRSPDSFGPNGYIDRNSFSYICGVAPSKGMDTIKNTQNLMHAQKEAVKCEFDYKVALYY